jgi:hypothetical protein
MMVPFYNPIGDYEAQHGPGSLLRAAHIAVAIGAATGLFLFIVALLI